MTLSISSASLASTKPPEESNKGKKLKRKLEPKVDIGTVISNVNTLGKQAMSSLDIQKPGKAKKIKPLKSFVEEVEEDPFAENPFEGTFFSEYGFLNRFRCECTYCHKEVSNPVIFDTDEEYGISTQPAMLPKAEVLEGKREPKNLKSLTECNPGQTEIASKTNSKAKQTFSELNSSSNEAPKKKNRTRWTKSEKSLLKSIVMSNGGEECPDWPEIDRIVQDEMPHRITKGWAHRQMWQRMRKKGLDDISSDEEPSQFLRRK